MLIRASSKRPAPSHRGRALTPAQKAIAEKWHAKYFNLSCGHVSTWETDQIYSFGKPSKNKSWCEACSKWSTMIKPGQVVKAYPDAPLF